MNWTHIIRHIVRLTESGNGARESVIGGTPPCWTYRFVGLSLYIVIHFWGGYEYTTWRTICFVVQLLCLPVSPCVFVYSWNILERQIPRTRRCLIRTGEKKFEHEFSNCKAGCRSGRIISGMLLTLQILIEKVGIHLSLALFARRGKRKPSRVRRIPANSPAFGRSLRLFHVTIISVRGDWNLCLLSADEFFSRF